MSDSPDAAVTTPAQEPYRLPSPPSAVLRAGLAVAAGAALAAAFAPLNLWPLAVLCPAVLLWLWQDATPGEAARLGFCFNCATFTAGTYWLYASIHVRSEEHTSELQSRRDLVCRLLLVKNNCLL